MAKREIVARNPDQNALGKVVLVQSEGASELLREPVSHLRQNRTQLREEWVSNIKKWKSSTP
jgi:hypothetical protein